MEVSMSLFLASLEKKNKPTNFHSPQFLKMDILVAIFPSSFGLK